MPFIWVALAIPILLLLQRWIHLHLQGIALLLSGKQERAVVLYALVLFPGVLLHEASHWLFATLLGVKTGRFSLTPRLQKNGTVQLGYVEYYKDSNLGPFRESVIGGAPLIAGTVAILLIGIRIFNIEAFGTAVQSGNIDQLVAAVGALIRTNDFLVWLYLLFAIANGMMPSRSDRQAWPAFFWLLGGVTVLLYLLGVGDVLISGLAEPATLLFSYLGLAFALAIATDLIFMLLLTILEAIISALKGDSVVY